MSQSDDTNPNRGRPVLKRVDGKEVAEDWDFLIREGRLWLFCDEHDYSEHQAVDAAAEQYGKGIFKAFPRGSWPGGYLRD